MFEDGVLVKIFGHKSQEVKGLEKITFGVASCFVLLTKYYGDHITEVEIGGACAAYGRQESVLRILLGNMKERSHWEDLVVDGSIALSVS
jgi:hypothetical protein